MGKHSINKLPSLICLLLLWFLSYEIEKCQAQDILTIISAASTLKDFTEKFILKIDNTDTEKIMSLIRDIRTSITHDIRAITNIIADLPLMIDLLSKRETLQGQFDHISEIFSEAVEMKKLLDSGSTMLNERYQQFRNDHEHEIDQNLFEIYRIVLDRGTASFLTRKFINELQKFENICKTNMSELQLLDSLLSSVLVATSQYRITKSLMQDFLEYTGKPTDKVSRQQISKKVYRSYMEALDNFKALMKTASLQLWLCDPVNGYTASMYYHLETFTRYVVNENIFAHYGSKCQHEPRFCYGMNRLNNCGNNNGLCEKFRLCPNELMDCRLLLDQYPEATICVNSNPAAYARYKSIIVNPKTNSKTCTDGIATTIKDEGYQDFFGSKTTCHYCQCICRENEYYISWAGVTANKDVNEVVTGARLILDERTLYVQIQAGELGPNGYIKSKTVSWRPYSKANVFRKKITWDGLKEIDLTDVVLSNDRVVVGLKLSIVNNRIQLNVMSNKFDFETGILSSEVDAMQWHHQKLAQNKFQIYHCDNPIKSNGENVPIGHNQFISFTPSSITKDGGQTTLPLIDAREIVTNPPALLSGAGLILRGKDQCGGFLGLMLNTYNITAHVDMTRREVDFSLDDDIDGKYKKLNAFTEYIVNENMYEHYGDKCQMEERKCYGMENYRRCDKIDGLCTKTRSCPNELKDCQLLFKEEVEALVCVNRDSSAYDRYKNVIFNPKSNANCIAGKPVKIKDQDFGDSSTCHFCHCICRENDYYVSTMLSGSSTFLNEVVTGARLVLEDDTLYIQVQVGELGPYRSIKEETIHWQDYPKDDFFRVKITWVGIREIDLTEVISSKNSVLVGLQFQKSNKKRIRMDNLSHKVNFETGELSSEIDSLQTHIPDTAESEYKLENCGDPSKSKKPKIHITKNHFVKFTSSSLSLDGGQTTLPIIDTQDYFIHPPMPLSRAGLVLRGDGDDCRAFLGIDLYI